MNVKAFLAKELSSSQEVMLLIDELIVHEVLIQDGKLIQLQKLEGGGYEYYEVLGIIEDLEQGM